MAGQDCRPARFQGGRSNRATIQVAAVADMQAKLDGDVGPSSHGSHTDNNVSEFVTRNLLKLIVHLVYLFL